jgi:protein O-mannosyl-transferase
MPQQTENDNFSGQVRTAATKHHWLQWPGTQIGLILALGLGVYLHTLHAPFIFDDYPCITENPAIRDFAYFTDFAKVRDLPIWEDIKNSFALRPVTYLTFALNYQLGQLNVFGYHLVNTAIHLLNAVLVYLLARVTLQQAPLVSSGKSAARVAGFIPLLVALLFVVHPLQTQAVTYIAQRFTSLSTLFYFATLLLYISARTARAPARRWSCYGLALLFAIVGMKTKEIAFTLPFMLLLYELFFLDGGKRQRLLWLTPFFLTLLVIPGTLLWLVATDGVTAPEWKIDQALNLANARKTSEFIYLKTQFGVIVTYLRLFFLPIGQNVIPGYPPVKSFFEPKIIASFLLLLTFFVGAIRLALRSFQTGQRSPGRLIAFGILWFFVTIAMSSSIIPLDVNLLEYRVYLPSFGFFFAFVVATTLAVDKGWLSSRLFYAAAILIVLLLAATTVARNNIYNDKVVMYQDVLAKNPKAIGARIGLATTFLENQRYDEALAELTVIVQKLPNDSNMISNLGYALAAKGRMDEASTQYRKALTIHPDNSFAHGNLGFAYLNLGRLAEAETEMLIALRLAPDFGAVRYQLALLYDQQGRIAEAIAQYRELLKSYPDNLQAISRLQQLEAAASPPTF